MGAQTTIMNIMQKVVFILGAILFAVATSQDVVVPEEDFMEASESGIVNGKWVRQNTYQTTRMKKPHYRERTPRCSMAHMTWRLKNEKWLNKKSTGPVWMQLKNYCRSDTCKNWLICGRHRVHSGSDGRSCGYCPRACFICECMDQVKDFKVKSVKPNKQGLYSCQMTPY